jgi:hypothetical protein
MNDTYTPASLYAGLIGAVLVVAGIIGFFYSSSFGDPGEVDAVPGVLDSQRLSQHRPYRQRCSWNPRVHVGPGGVANLRARLWHHLHRRGDLGLRGRERRVDSR